MNRAIRGGIILLICLLAVFPCGAALTVIGTIVGEAIRSFGRGGSGLHPLLRFGTPLFWAGGGIIGFLFLISGVDRLIAAQRRLPWYMFAAIVLEIAAAGLFSSTYPLRGPSALVFRLISVAPVVIALAFLIHHIGRFIFRSGNANSVAGPSSSPVTPSANIQRP